MTLLLDDLMSKYGSLNIEKQLDLSKDAIKKTGNLKFLPSPGPQTVAYLSDADIMLYGGEAGGGKTGLLLGLAMNAHHRSLILRRKYADLNGLTEELVKLYGSRDGFAGGSRPKLRTDDGRLIEFGACQHLGDEQGWQGQPHDFIGFDECVQFLETQVRFLMAWNRSAEPGQRCRVVLASNPPVDVQGDWIIDFFGPWLNPQHPNPAKDGELRWFVTDENGKDLEVEDNNAVEIDGKLLEPHSRTFIKAKLADNPFLAKTDYAKRLDAMPEPYRSAFRDGNFMASREDASDQLIPTQWVREAQARWQPAPPEGIPMCAVSGDIACGGKDETIISARYDYWFAPLVAKPGVETPTGREAAAMVLANRRDNCHIIIDMGGGYGNEVFSCLKDNLSPESLGKLIAYKGADGTTRRTKDSMVGYTNKRSEAYWKFREALDPSQPGGSPIQLPDDAKLLADLTAPTFKLETRGYKVEPKEDVCKKLGRSTDRGDAVIMCWFEGQRALNTQAGWKPARSASNNRPAVVVGYQNRRR